MTLLQWITFFSAPIGGLIIAAGGYYLTTPKSQKAAAGLAPSDREKR